MKSNSPVNKEGELQSSIAAYARDGYCIARNILSKNDISALHRDMERVLASQLQFLGRQVRIGQDNQALFHQMKRLFQCDKSRYLASLRLFPKLYSFQMLMLDPGIAEFVKALGLNIPVMQARPVFHVMSHELRFDDGYFGFGVHQDWPALQGSLDMVTAWVPFVDVDRDLFTLEVIPGSHVHGLLPGKVTDHILEIDPEYYSEADFVPVEANKGDVVFMSAFALHRSSLNGRVNDVRLAASCRYENAEEAKFIEHAFPFCQKTVVGRELLFNNFPTPQQVNDACLKPKAG